eukprot:TRINITY_DN4132_c0_g1_i5.p1 TRINITY_DN4132_c0_g1~~TRINITY_DN4132_c0_g1_i5.p1  ORF type:complete len:298 (+),score=85.17 TRINITY_DN4132_c0_g1_i5:1339-2232(+)
MNGPKKCRKMGCLQKKKKKKKSYSFCTLLPPKKKKELRKKRRHTLTHAEKKVGGGRGEEKSLAAMTLSGVVKMWNDDKGFGFITPDIQGGSDIFCHRSCLPTMQCMLIAGEPVTYDLDHREGRPRAANVSGRAVHDRLQYLAAPGGGGGWGQPSGAGCPPGKEAGTVRKWFDEKGFGFIGPSSGGSDIFVLRSAFGNKGGLIEGEMVFFGTAPNPKNPDKVQAAEVEGPGVTDYDMRSYGGWAAAGGGWGGVGVGGGGGGCVVGKKKKKKKKATATATATKNAVLLATLVASVMAGG